MNLLINLKSSVRFNVSSKQVEVLKPPDARYRSGTKHSDYDPHKEKSFGQYSSYTKIQWKRQTLKITNLLLLKNV